MACLLVSVRSAAEARAAVSGGASIIDVKEPDRGPLGCADQSVWREVRAAVPVGIPVSVALGELRDWMAPAHASHESVHDPFRGFSFRKLGLSDAGPDWSKDWAALRRQWGDGPAWVAVIYADWQRAKAPPPDHVLNAALATDECGGLLIDTWDKRNPSPVDLSWASWFDRARSAGLLTVLAGQLTPETIGRLAPLRPDIFAVRGAACYNGDRRAGVDPNRVAALVQAARGV